MNMKTGCISMYVFVVVQAYGQELSEALEWCKKYQRTHNVKELTKAWDSYYHVFRRISKQLPMVSEIEAIRATG